MSRSDQSVGIVLAIALFMLVWKLFFDDWGVDLSAIYFAAYSYGTGQYDLIYQSTPEFFFSSASLVWEGMAADMGFGEQTVLPYIYAPIWAAILAPIATAVPPDVFFEVFLALHVVLCLASVVLAWRIVRPDTMSFGAWALVAFLFAISTTPFIMGFILNQPQFIVTVLVLLSFERIRAGAPVAAGIALGIAAAIKITPAVFVIIFLMDRNWRAAGVMVVTGLGLLALSFAIAGVDLHVQFLEQIERAGSHLVLTTMNYSFEGLLAAWSLDPADPSLTIAERNAYYVRPVTPWVGAASKACLVVFTIVLWALTRDVDPVRATCGRLLALWCAVIFFGPLGWTHYLIGPLFLFPAVIVFLGRLWGTAAIGVVYVLLAQPTQIILAPLDLSYGTNMTFGPVALCVMAVAGIAAARSAPDRL